MMAIGSEKQSVVYLALLEKRNTGSQYKGISGFNLEVNQIHILTWVVLAISRPRLF